MAHPLTNVQLQAIMTAAMQAVNEKNLKTPEQKQFSGQAKDLANFLQECDLWFKVFPTTYSNAMKKVFYALSLMTTGTAKVWKNTFINEWKGQNDLCQAMTGHSSKHCWKKVLLIQEVFTVPRLFHMDSIWNDIWLAQPFYYSIGTTYSIWNGYGMVNSIWSPHGIHMDWCLIRFHMYLNHGLHEQVHAFHMDWYIWTPWTDSKCIPNNY